MDMETPLDVDSWPGNKEIVKKVPTKLWYRAGCKKPVSWGFDQPAELHRGMDVIDCFKLYLDPDFQLGSTKNSPEVFWTDEDVQTWFIDFLTALRQHIIKHIRNTEQLAQHVVGDWRLHPVEYIFSFPTTWQNPKVVDAFRGIVMSSGFGDCEAHSVEIKMSEAAAAAVYSAKTFKNQQAVQNPKGSKQLAVANNEERIRDGDVILICDAGGGTTDVAVLKVIETQKFEIRGQVEEVLQLGQLDFVNGIPIGSVQIDQGFQREIEDRLKRIDYQSEDGRWSPKSAARDLTTGDFQAIKQKYGYRIAEALDLKAPRVPGLPKSYNNAEAGFENGRIILADFDICRLFEEQIQRIFEMIDEQLERIEDFPSPEKVTHFVLSGGLGSSPYVQERFRSNYGEGKAAKQVLISEAPQLAVCRGLVIDRIHRLRCGHSTISPRYSSLSYGIVANSKVGGNKTLPRKNDHVKINPYDGKRYIVNEIQWLIKQNQRIDKPQYISQTFNRVFESTSSEISWQNFIAMSRSPATRLPHTINEGDARVICEIESSVDQELLLQHAQPVKGRKWWASGWKQDLQKIQYEVRLCIGSSSLAFEVCLGDRVVGKSDEIRATWQYTDMDVPGEQDTQSEWPVDWSNIGRAKEAKK
ncbi:hypothetical protein AJ78_07869 [Emergomyces pasteurianus Ep9510]|uniref:Uncharacterized protein n=1 Tax=Emergomyces pasteurianus Ep9510 TaxID=1447872 RepID=A0A1J9P633_9EURO|nr:hypothetical protein AJ78_07869 [Emergomyces pasteurianus Ep9510]